MLVGVGRVDLEPPLNRVPPVFGVRPLAPPLFVGHAVENLRRRAARRLERLERGFDGPVVVQAAGEFVLVVAGDARSVDREQQPQAHRRCHLAVGEVMHHLARRPLAGRRSRIQVLVLRADQRLGDDAVSVLVLIDQLLASLSRPSSTFSLSNDQITR